MTGRLPDPGLPPDRQLGIAGIGPGHRGQVQGVPLLPVPPLTMDVVPPGWAEATAATGAALAIKVAPDPRQTAVATAAMTALAERAENLAIIILAPRRSRFAVVSPACCQRKKIRLPANIGRRRPTDSLLRDARAAAVVVLAIGRRRTATNATGR